MKLRLILLLCGLTVLPLGAALASGGEEKPADPDACVEAPAEGEGAAKEEKGGHGGEKGELPPCPVGPQFVEIGPISVPILDGERVKQYVTIVLNLETPDYKVARMVKRYIPALKDAYLSRLYSAFAVNNGLNKGLVDIDRLRGRLQQATLSVLPQGMEAKVLLQTVNQRSN